MKKVALLGGVKSTLMLAPFTDPSWAIWSHASVPLSSVKRVDRWFDLHPELCYTMAVKNGRRYYEWLQGLTTPIYMQKHVQAIPASVKYPRERIQAEWPGIPFGSQTAWMIALALSEGYDTIGLFGIHYQHDTEYEEQRANAELWVGVAYGRGVKVVIPEGCPLAKEPVQRYGYDTHSAEDFARRRAAMKAAKDRDAVKRAELAGKKPFDPSRLVPMEWPRPETVAAGA
jgi:hypothetical protein